MCIRDMAYGISEFSGKLGQQIAAPCVTALDDGTCLLYTSRCV